MSDYFNTVSGQAGSVGGAAGDYYSGNVDITQSLAAASLGNAAGLESPLIGKGVSAAQAESDAAAGLAGGVSGAYGSYSSSLIGDSNDAGQAAIDASRELSKKDVANRIAYMKAVAQADYDVAVAKAKAVTQYYHAQTDLYGDHVIDPIANDFFCYGDSYDCYENGHIHQDYYYAVPAYPVYYEINHWLSYQYWMPTYEASSGLGQNPYGSGVLFI